MNITSGRITKAKKVVIYGVEGIGKSTLAAHFPDPLFIDTEGSTDSMDVRRFDPPSSWTMIKAQAEYVLHNPDICRTLVVDTADWAERMMLEQMCSEKHWSGLEDPGWGKGYTYAAEEFGRFLDTLTDINSKGINVVLTAHAQLRKIELPEEMGSYDHYEMKLSKKVAPMVREWATMVLFCNYKTMVVNVDGQGSIKGKNKAQGGRRVMYTTHTPFWDAKNRDNLPEELDLDYSGIAGVIAAVPRPEPVRAEGAAANGQRNDRQDGQKATEPKQAELPIYPSMETRADMPTEPVEPAREPMQAAPEKAETPPKNEAAAKAEGFESAVGLYCSDPSKIPKQLRNLMEADKVDEWGLQDAIFQKEFYPRDTLLQDMDPDFLIGWAVAYWPQVKELVAKIKAENGIPFN